MRFNLACAVFALGFAASAAEPGEAFADHREDIAAGRVTAAGGCLFGVGTAEICGKSALAQDAARRKAELAAQSDLLANEALKKVQWPADWSPEQIASARAFAKTHVNYSANATVRGMITLENTVSNEHYVAVVGVPESSVSVRTHADFASVKKAMDDFAAAERKRAEKAAAAQATATSETNGTSSVAVPVAPETPERDAPSREFPVDLGDGKKILMDNSDKNDLLF